MDPDLLLAAINGDLDFLQTFHDKSDLHSQLTPSEDTALHVATEFNQPEFAAAAAHCCPPLLWKVNSSGDTALHIAARDERLDLVMLFIGCARKVDEATGESKHLKLLLRMVNRNKDTALHCAARSGSCESVKLLAEADTEVCSFVNNADESPLYLCVASGFYGIHQYIIDCAPSSALYKGPRGLTALHPTLFFQTYSLEKIEALVRWRREMIGKRDNLGMTPLHYAAFYGRIEAMKLFLEYDSSAILLLNKNGDSALHIAAFEGHINVLEELIKCRPDCYNLINNKGRTPLHSAVLGRQVAAVEFILKTPTLERLTNKQDKDGNTALHLAVLHKFYAAIHIITDSTKLSARIVNNRFLTPFDVSDEHDEEVSRAAVSCLDLKMGLMTMHQSAKAQLEKMNKELRENGREEKKTSSSFILNKKSDDQNSELHAALEVILLVAMLVATVTFAAGFTVPGGFISSNGEDQGLAILTKKPAFKVFIVFNTLAFCCSVFAVLFQLHSSLIDYQRRGSQCQDHQLRVRYIKITAFFTTVAILALVLAFSSGTFVVLTESTGLCAYVMCACCFVVLYFGLVFLRRKR
ncbi:ankyrin-2-like [Momordica charantia]|uniref:Ankyrin-2-like n=1 Tax=Momordica charantia TaxID=3673 RepID=A0A6J1CNI9_MOMCH|nr:ankyrin-2-like [Momordica charantia]